MTWGERPVEPQAPEGVVVPSPAQRELREIQRLGGRVVELHPLFVVIGGDPTVRIVVEHFGQLETAARKRMDTGLPTTAAARSTAPRATAARSTATRATGSPRAALSATTRRQVAGHP